MNFGRNSYLAFSEVLNLKQIDLSNNFLTHVLTILEVEE